MSYHLVTREEITGITIYTRVEQIRSASIIRYAYATLVSETIKDIMKSSKVTPVSI